MRDLMAARLGVPKVDGQNYIDKTAIRRAGIRVNWLGTGLVAPKGAVDGDGFVELDVPPPSERS